MGFATTYAKAPKVRKNKFLKRQQIIQKCLQSRYLDVSVYEGEDEAAAPIFFNVEEVLPDYKEKFTKWCNNVNYIDKSQVGIGIVSTAIGR